MVKENVVLKISGKTISSLPKQEGEDKVEFTTLGEMKSRGNVTSISYDETPLSGMEGCTTSITITPGKLKMKRSGDLIQNETVMEFEEGKRYNGMYDTPYGNINMEILTSKVSLLKPVGDAKVCNIEYAISLKGLVEATKTLDIEIRPIG